jgi:death-on-curing protein
MSDSAAHRPQASAFGQEAYPTVHGKAAALLDAVVRNHALVDGNKRLGWARPRRTGSPPGSGVGRDR